jgi:hypothetical protein
MTMSAETPDVLAFWDVLIPGAEGWPSASEALGDSLSRMDLLPEADEAWMKRHAACFSAMPMTNRTRAVEAVEQSQPARFRRVLTGLYEAYYSSAPVQAAVLRLAEAGPREASASFDESLLRKVRATNAGQRRLEVSACLPAAVTRELKFARSTR